MDEGKRTSMPVALGQAQVLVEYVENPQHPVEVGMLTWAHYYHVKIALLQSDLSLQEKIRYTHLFRHPRALTAVELEQYFAKEIAYLQERLEYVERKLQQLWQTAGLSEEQWRTIREGLELTFTYRELTEMWERGV